MDESPLQQIKRLERERGLLLAELREIVRQEDEQYLREYRATDAVNNSDGVGVHFNFAEYPEYPKWYVSAVELIKKLEAK
jgi:hypothetical protein